MFSELSNILKPPRQKILMRVSSSKRTSLIGVAIKSAI
jgi:hypothetical protein